MKTQLSLETVGHSNAIVSHDGHGNKTVLVMECDEPERYASLVRDLNTTETKHTPSASAILARYGRHDRECVLCHDANLPGDPRCTCGFSAAQVQAQHNAQPKLLAALEKIAVGTSPASVALQFSNAEALCAELHSIAQAAIAKARSGK